MTTMKRAVATIVLLALGLSAGCAPPEKPKQQQDPAPPARNGQPLKAGNINYVALGDSFTAAPLVSAPQKWDECMRSQQNYPSQVAQALNVKSFADMSCAGAQTKDFATRQYPKINAQFDGLKPDTNLVTVSMGGNDFGVYGTLVGQCAFMKGLDPTGAPCKTALELGASETTGFRGHMVTISDRLVRSIREIRRRSPKAKVVVVGYPQMVPPGRKKCDILPLANGDYAYVRWMNVLLDAALRKAAQRTNATFIDVLTASKGHDVCSKDPWLNGSQGKSNALTFHPYLAEQTAVAKLIVAELRK